MAPAWRTRTVPGAMWYRDLLDEAERWQGLALTLDRGSPALRIELANRRRMRVSLAGRALVWSCVVDQYQGVWLLRAPQHESPHVVPPIRADEVRAAPEPGPAWWRHWARHAARTLEGSERGPLRTGRWVLRPAKVFDPTLPDLPAAWRVDVGLVRHVYGRLDRFGCEVPRYETWGINGSGAIFALRAPSAPGAARVKAWRKAAASGPLPPGLALSVTGMDMFALLDGHDRLQAATLERQPFALLLLEHEGTPREPSAKYKQEMDEYLTAKRAASEQRIEQAVARGAGPLEIDRLSREYTAYWQDFSPPRYRSSCTPLPGGAERWGAEVRAQLGAPGPEGEHPMLRNEWKCAWGPAQDALETGTPPGPER